MQKRAGVCRLACGHICAVCMSSVGQSASHIISYGSSVCLTLMHFPVACLHSLAEVLCVSEARAGAESLMDGVQGSRTSAVVGHIAARRNHTRSPWVCTRVHSAFCCFFYCYCWSDRKAERVGGRYIKRRLRRVRMPGAGRGVRGCRGQGSEPP